MISIRKRWPILTAVVAALAYGFNNYQIAGVEHLRLEPRASIYGSATAPTGQPGVFSGFEFPQNAANNIFGNGPTSSTFDSIPPWKDMLSVGEKLNIWQDARKNSQSASPKFLPDSNFPIATPIPVPTGLNADWSSKSPGAHVAFPNLLPPVSADNLPSTMQPIQPPVNGQLAEVPGGSFVSAPTPVFNTSGVDAIASGNKIRVASFNLGGLGPAKLAKPQVMELLVRILEQYDVVALQEVRSTRDDILPILVERLNQSGRNFDYMIGPRVGRQTRDQFAFIFDTSRVETDRFQLYTVDDPEDLMTYDPLVAWFRCKGVATDKAFTFSLVNINVDPQAASVEQSLLPNLIDAIERDGRQEDDWILLGNFSGSSSQLSHLRTESIRFGIQDVPTDVSGERMLDSLVFSSRGTTEFTGRSGVFDFLRKFNLSLENALEVSGHLPIWAEFSIVEGSEPGRIAPVDLHGMQ